jgi:hypothetical protein
MEDSAAESPPDPPDDSSSGPDGSGPLTLDRILGAAASVLAIVAAIFSWPAIPGYIAKGFALVGFVILLFILGRIYGSLKGKRLTWRSAVDFAAVGVLSVCLTVVLLNIGGSGLSTLRFVQASAQDVCQVYYGTGTIPKGYDLLIFDSPPHGDYYLDGLAVNQRRAGWKSPLIMAGNNPTLISAVLVPATTGTSLKEVFPYSQDPTVEAKIRDHRLALLTRSLPFSEEHIPSLNVHPPKGNTGCPK